MLAPADSTVSQRRPGALRNAMLRIRVPAAVLGLGWALMTSEPARAAAEAPGAAPERPAVRAARSVHLGYIAPDAEAFYLELVVDRSTPGSYFMACGWNTGYFGIQELADGRKVALFSVWDPTRGDDPGAVSPEDRVELLHEGSGVRIRRFGGEGTGGQCMTDFDWQPGQTNRFLVAATVQSNKTAYAGWLWRPDRRAWQHLVTFRTRTGGQPLRGLYSFIEDFRRDGRSVHEVRRARFFNGWVKLTAGPWQPLTRARFTASGAAWEARDNIDAGLAGEQFYLATGGDTRMSRTLGSVLELPAPPSAPPADLPPLAVRSAARPPRGYTIPLIDLAGETSRQVIVDREPGQYLGHPSTVLLEDGRTILCVYPKGHGKGPIVLKRSSDGGRTWSERLPVPENWATSLETPTIHRVVDAAGRRRLIVWSGLYPARLAVSEDDGVTWTPLRPVGDWGGIVVMGSVVPRRTGPGHYLAMFHDDGRFFTRDGRPANPVVFHLYQTHSTDGGLTWSTPREIWQGREVHLCEPGVVRSPDGRQLAALLRENRRVRNAHVIFSQDEGRTWSAPRELPGALTGDRHTARYAPDGRLFISFRDTALESPTQGDWVAWVGRYEDLVAGREGQYRVRLGDNHHAWDCAYPGVEVLPDGTLVAVTYGHWTPGEPPYLVCVRLRLEELDARAR